MTNEFLKTIQEALTAINRLFAVLELKDAEIKRLQERVAMLEFARKARTQLETAKCITEMIQ